MLCLCTGDYDGLGKIRVPELRASCKVLVPTVANVMYVMRCGASSCVYVSVYACVCVCMSVSVSVSVSFITTSLSVPTHEDMLLYVE